MAIEPTYNIYPIIEFARVDNDFGGDPNFAGSVDFTNMTKSPTSRKGSFIIGFTETYNNPNASDQIVFTFDKEAQTGTSQQKKRLINIFLAQHQYSNITQGLNLFGVSIGLATHFYDISFCAFSSAQSNRIIIRSEDFSNSSLPDLSSHYYPLDFTNCLQYNASNDTFEFKIKPLLDNNGNVINNNTLFKGYYILS